MKESRLREKEKFFFYFSSSSLSQITNQPFHRPGREEPRGRREGRHRGGDQASRRRRRGHESLKGKKTVLFFSFFRSGFF